MKRLKQLLLGLALLIAVYLYERSQQEGKKMPERVPSNWSTGMKVWLLAALTVILVNMLAIRNAYGQVSVVRAPLGGYGAITTCDQENNIVVVVNNTVPSEDYPEVLLHEYVHVEEMKVYPGGCQAMLNRYRADVQFRFEVEARAYCKGYEYRVVNGMPKENIQKLAEYVQKLYAKENTVDEVRSALPCGRDVVIAPKDGTSTPPP